MVGGDQPLENLRVSVYNLRQTLSVMRENIPSQGDAGLGVLRDLFYQFYISTPADHQYANQGWHNNLSIALRLVRAGLARQAGRMLSRFDGNEPELRDMMAALVDGASAPQLADAIRPLVALDRNHDLLWGLFARVFENIDSPEAAPHMRQTVFYGLATLERLDVSSSLEERGASLVDKGIKAVAAITNSDSDRQFLQLQAGMIGESLASQHASFLMRSLAEKGEAAEHASDLTHLRSLLMDVFADTRRGTDAVEIWKSVQMDRRASQAWSEFVARAKAIPNQPGYSELQVGALGQEFLNFVEGNGTPASVDAASQLRIGVGNLLQNGQIDQLLWAVKQNPNDFNQLLESASHSLEDGELKNFFAFVRRSLGN
jgi:hypothetical protein